MPTVKVSDPVMFSVDMVADNFALHISIIPRAQILFPKGCRTAAADGRGAVVRLLSAMGPVSHHQVHVVLHTRPKWEWKTSLTDGDQATRCLGQDNCCDSVAIRPNKAFRFRLSHLKYQGNDQCLTGCSKPLKRLNRRRQNSDSRPSGANGATQNLSPRRPPRSGRPTLPGRARPPALSRSARAFPQAHRAR
jgi:hypothetical protein